MAATSLSVCKTQVGNQMFLVEKLVVKPRSFAKMIQREVEALSAVQHRNIIELLGLCMDNESSDGGASIRVSLIFKFANGRTLFDCLFGGQAKNSKFKLDVN